MMLVPFMSQMPTRPAVCRQRISALPSPLKSADPFDGPVQADAPGSPMPLMLVPFMNHMADQAQLCRHRMSALPSPSKSPTPWKVQPDRLPGVPVPTSWHLHEPDPDQTRRVPPQESFLLSPSKSRGRVGPVGPGGPWDTTS